MTEQKYSKAMPDPLTTYKEHVQFVKKKILKQIVEDDEETVIIVNVLSSKPVLVQTVFQID